MLTKLNRDLVVANFATSTFSFSRLIEANVLGRNDLLDISKILEKRGYRDVERQLHIVCHTVHKVSNVLNICTTCVC
jgi:hypothetical protein